MMRLANRKTITLSLMLMALILAGSGAAQADENLWFHVSVQEGDSTSVNVNLPLRMIEKALPMIPQDEIQVHDGKVRLDHLDMSMQELRELFAEIRNSPDMTFVSVEEEHESVQVSKSGEYLLVHVDERSEDGENGEKVNVKVPLDVVEALLSGDGDELRIEDALKALAAHGAGELVTVESESETVRVWIDGTAAGS